MGNIIKTDKLDDKDLATLVHLGNLPTVWLPPDEIRDEREMILSPFRLHSPAWISNNPWRGRFIIGGSSQLRVSNRIWVCKTPIMGSNPIVLILHLYCRCHRIIDLSGQDVQIRCVLLERMDDVTLQNILWTQYKKTSNQ